MDLRNVVLLVVLGVVFLLLFSARPIAVPHQRAAAPIHILIVLTCGLLALFSIVGGIVAIIRGPEANTEFSLLGAELSTSDVGVALVGIGLLITYFTTRSVLRSARGRAALPVGKLWKSQKPKNRRAHEPFR
jgi:hypothetical protein